MMAYGKIEGFGVMKTGKREKRIVNWMIVSIQCKKRA